jgi:hypothetical protein
MGLTYNTKTFQIASGGTSGYVELESFPVLGLYIPAITSGTIQLKVSEDATTFYPVVDLEGTTLLDASGVATTGNIAISSRSLSDVIGYKYLGVFCENAQAEARTLTLKMKAPYTR